MREYVRRAPVTSVTVPDFAFESGTVVPETVELYPDRRSAGCAVPLCGDRQPHSVASSLRRAASSACSTSVTAFHAEPVADEIAAGFSFALVSIAHDRAEFAGSARSATGATSSSCSSCSGLATVTPRSFTSPVSIE